MMGHWHIEPSHEDRFNCIYVSPLRQVSLCLANKEYRICYPDGLHIGCMGIYIFSMYLFA